MSKPTPQQERVALRRSLYAPANARKNRLPTQAFLRAAEFGDLPAVRSLALEANAELSGLRCKNFLECDPHHLVDSAHYLNNEERKHLKYQFTELPELLNAVGTVQKLPPKLGHSASSPLDEGPKKRPETPALAKTKGITGRLARSENNLTRLASTLAGRHHVSEAAKSQPQLLWEKARAGEQALPALAKALRSERLAVKAAQMNPKLLRVSESQIRKIMPTLVSICGGAEQAAYAIVWRPDLLELESAASFRDSLQAASCFFGNLKDAASCFFGNLKDALFLLGQTTAPPSVKIIARQFCREYMVGEYFLVDGASVDDRPVWCKPAVQMKALGSRATDVYLIYCQKGVVGSDTMHPCWTITTNYSPSLKKYDYCDPNILGWAESKVKSPDQLEPGDWHFPAEDHKTQVPGLWPADPYVRCTDGGRDRGPWLCTHAPRQLRNTFDMLRFATGLLWLTAESAESAELLGHLAKNDPVYSGLKKITFLDLADFAHIRRWTYLRLPATTASGTVVSFTAWEPVEVCMLFAAGESCELDAREVEVLQKGDFRVMPEDSVAKSFPTLEGASHQVSKQVWARTYGSGRFDLQVPLGPDGLPPMIFLRAHVAAHVLGKRPCHMVRLLAEEEIYLSDDAGPTAAAGELDATVLPKPKPVMYHFVSPGELGYTGYSLFKGPSSSQHCERSEVQMRVESMETLSVAMLLFPAPKVEVSTLEEAPQPKADAKKRPSKSSRGSISSSKPEPTEPQKVPSKETEAVIIPPPPEWITATGWHELPQKLYASVRATAESEKITCSHVYLRTVQPNEVLEVPGCGPDFFALFLFKQLSPARPDLLKQLVMREPNLLTSGQQFNHFFSHLRAELGDPLARGIIMRDLTTVVPPGPQGHVVTRGPATIWQKLCQNTTAEEDLSNWIYERKVEILGRETGEAPAPRILSHPDTAAIPAPDLQDRCGTLRSLMQLGTSGSSSSLGDVLLQRRQLLCCDVASLQGSFDTIQEHLGQAEAFKAAAEHSKLLTQHNELIHFFEVLNEKFTDRELRQFYDKAGREWVKWPSFVGRSDEEIHTWQGRLMALFRHGRCQERVQHFGASAYGAAAVAQNSGVIPDIPPLID